FTAASGTIYTVNSGTAKDVAGGVAVRVAVDKTGTPWCVTTGKAIFRLVNGTWVQLPGAAVDVGAGGDGSVYIVNPDLSISKWNGSGWTVFNPGSGGTRIAVDQSGNPWVVNSGNQIYRWTGSSWTLLPGAARDISISPDGQAYVLGMQSGPGGYL